MSDQRDNRFYRQRARADLADAVGEFERVHPDAYGRMLAKVERMAEEIARRSVPGDDDDFRAWSTDALRLRCKVAAREVILAALGPPKEEDGDD